MARQRHAATRIQAAWRGHRARRSPDLAGRRRALAAKREADALLRAQQEKVHPSPLLLCCSPQQQHTVPPHSLAPPMLSRGLTRGCSPCGCWARRPRRPPRSRPAPRRPSPSSRPREAGWSASACTPRCRCVGAAAFALSDPATTLTTQKTFFIVSLRVPHSLLLAEQAARYQDEDDFDYGLNPEDLLADVESILQREQIAPPPAARKPAPPPPPAPPAASGGAAAADQGKALALSFAAPAAALGALPALAKAFAAKGGALALAAGRGAAGALSGLSVQQAAEASAASGTTPAPLRAAWPAASGGAPPHNPSSLLPPLPAQETGGGWASGGGRPPPVQVRGCPWGVARRARTRRVPACDIHSLLAPSLRPASQVWAAEDSASAAEAARLSAAGNDAGSALGPDGDGEDDISVSHAGDLKSPSGSHAPGLSPEALAAQQAAR